MAAHSDRPSFTQGVAKRVLDACRREDTEASITYVGVDETGRTRVRVQSSISSSVETLQRTLRKAMPFAIVRASENVLDGTLQAELMTRLALVFRLLSTAMAGARFFLEFAALTGAGCRVSCAWFKRVRAFTLYMLC